MSEGNLILNTMVLLSWNWKVNIALPSFFINRNLNINHLKISTKGDHWERKAQKKESKTSRLFPKYC